MIESTQQHGHQFTSTGILKLQAASVNNTNISNGNLLKFQHGLFQFLAKLSNTWPEVVKTGFADTQAEVKVMS